MKKTKLIAVLVCLTLTVALSLGFSLNASAANYGFFTKESIDPDEYAYSIAVIGDTQSLVDSDVKNAGNADYEPRLEKVYNWLVDNKDSKKIEMVLGLGDIVETWNSEAYPDAFRAEWEHATSEISKLDGNIPYTLVRGNHDTVEGFNTYIGAMDGYLSQFESDEAGFMYEDSYDTSYRRITLGTTDWLIITLDWATTGAELDWAGKIISENKDAQVIITLHSYLFHDMTLDGDGDTQDTAKHNPDWDDSIDPASTDNDPDLVYNPSGIWERLVSKHENIKFVLSGHVANGNMIHSQAVGDNGNTVTQMLVNPQGIDLDRNYPGGCGMVCMLYFREDGTLASTSEWDGNNVSVEWYSTIKDQYFKDENQFDLDLNLYDGGVPTEKYGVIPAKYADAEKYPFVTFGYDDDTGEYFFHSADSHWTTAESDGACLSLSRFSTKDAEAFILLRRDFNAKEAGDERYKNFGNLSVNLNIDLGGHEFVTNYYVFDANLKKESASNIRIYGAEGSAFVIGGANSLFWLGTNSAEANGSQFNYTFDGIRFAYSDSATASTMLMATFSASGDSAYSSTQNITFNNCTFDLTNAPDKAIKLMALNETVGSGYYIQKSNVTVENCEILANGMSDITIYSANETDKVVFDTVSLKLPKGASAPAGIFVGKDGKDLGFTLTASDESTDIYTLTAISSGEVKTEYGTIPAEFADADAYPFAVFTKDGFYAAYADWYTVLNNGTKFIKNADKCATVLLRDDYATAENSSSPNQLFGINGTLNFDLGGNTITINKKSHLFQFLNKCTAATETNLNLYNGSIVTSVSYTPFIVNGHADSTADWDVNVKCDGVRFVFAKGSAMTKLLLDTFTAGTTLTNFNATFTGCTFDISEATGAITFFNSKETGGLKSANIEIVGGSIITQALSNVTLYSFAESGDSLVISRDKSGNYPTLSVKSGADLTSEVISDSLGTDYGFTKLKTEGGYDVYALALADLSAIETPFGIIPGTYASEATYPFVVFKDKKFFEGYKTWDAFLSAGSKIITSADAGKNIVMLVRRDYATSENASSSQNWYTFKGNITIELDNHTITIDAKSHLFQLINKATSVYTTGITVNNGTIVTYKNYAPFTINGHANSTADWSVNLVCKGVTFKMHASSTLKNLVSETYTAGTTDTAVNATFNDCVFDLSAVSHAVNIFNVKEGSGSVKSANIVVNGGVIKAQSMSTVTVYTLAASGDSFVFGKGTGGKYTTLELPAGSSAPATTYPTVNGNYAYSFSTRVPSVGGVAYMLSPAELSALNLKTNVTLYSDFVLNAYFPVLTGISSVKVNGISVAFGDLETTEIDGKLYYILPTEVASSEAAEDIAVSITLTYGEDSFSAKWTLGVVKYAEKALATEQTETTKAMLRDMLSYVRASYKYFASVGAVTPEACEIATAKIDAIIGGDYDNNNAPKMEESAVLDPEGLFKATVSLGAKISFVFYPTEDAEKYTFTMGGAKLETEVKADGAYIVVTTYAYAVRETVEYTVEGTDISGSYNLKAYYEYMAGEGNGSDELIALVERLFKYSESCEAYRNEVNS